MGAMSMLQALLMNEEESERWYEKLKSFAKKQKGSLKTEANNKLLFLDISLPHRGSTDLIAIMRNAGTLLFHHKAVIQELSVTSNLPSQMNGGKDFCEWSRKDKELAASVGKVLSLVLGKYGKGFVNLALAETGFEKGLDHYEVETLAIRGRMEAESGGKLEQCFVAAGITARLAVFTNHPEHAIDILDGIYEMSEREQSVPLLKKNIQTMKCRVALYQGRTAEIAQWLKTAPNEHQEFFVMERFRYLTKVRIYLSDHRYEEAQHLLSKLEYYAQKMKRTYIAMETKLLQSILYDHEKDSSNTMKSPKMADVRGKIVLMSRVDFSDDIISSNFSEQKWKRLRSYTGPDLSKWDDIYDDSKKYAQVISPDTDGVKVLVQDNWQTTSGTKKKQFKNTLKQMNGNLTEDDNCSDAPIPDKKDFVFNFTSMNLSIGGFTPLEASRNMNDLIFDQDLLANNNRMGLVMMDYSNKAIASVIISQNQRYTRIPAIAGHNNPKKLAISSTQDTVPSYATLMTYATEQTKLLEAGAGITWPKAAAVTYGYVLDEAKLYFDDPDAQNQISGYFYFENGGDILSVKEDNGKPQTLIFESYDGTIKESRQIPIFVNPRPLPVSIGNYQVEYGDTFDIKQTNYPQAGGYFLAADQGKLEQLTDVAGLHYKVEDNSGNEATITTDTKPCSGTIRLMADRPDAVAHPNYDVSIENGVWTVLPRTVSVSWSRQEDGWEASIGNIINGDEVTAVVAPDQDGNGATLTLSGADASAYRIADGDEIAQEQPEDNIPVASVDSPNAVLILLGVFVLGLCGFFIFEKKRNIK